MNDIVYDVIISHLPFLKIPIFNLLLVKETRGMTAKLNCRERITWLNIRSFAVPPSPETNVTMNAGITAINLVTSLLTHGLRRIFKKPSIII